MKIIPIFAPHLYAISYPKSYTTVWNEEICSYFEDNEIGNIDELKRIFKLWSNPLYLDNFFFNNQNYLSLSYWLKKPFPTGDLPKITRDISIEFQKDIRKNKYTIESKFQPLDDSETKIIELSKAKSKKNWLRLYAIKITDNRFIITGGAIKLTEKMEDHPLTNDELIKLDKIKNLLIDSGVFDGDSFDDALYEITI